MRNLGAWLFVRPIQVLNRPAMRGILTVTLLAAALLSGLATYATLAGSFGLPRSETVVASLLALDLVLLVLLATLVAWHLVALWLERRRGLVGARLHLRLVLWFGLVALLPTIFISAFSVLFFVYGMDKLFGDRVAAAVKESLYVADAYVQEHKLTAAISNATLAQALQEKGCVIPDGFDFKKLLPVSEWEQRLTDRRGANSHRRRKGCCADTPGGLRRQDSQYSPQRIQNDPQPATAGHSVQPRWLSRAGDLRDR